jgi:hypothetical protein
MYHPIIINYMFNFIFTRSPHSLTMEKLCIPVTFPQPIKITFPQPTN